MSSGAETSGLRLWVLRPVCPGSWASGVRGSGGGLGVDTGDRAPLGGVPPLLFSWISAFRAPARAHTQTHTLRPGRGSILVSNWGQPPAKILGQAWGVAGVALAGG